MVSEEAASRWTEQFTLNWDATLFMMNPKSRPEAVWILVMFTSVPLCGL
jgi:hypothetical protein